MASLGVMSGHDAANVAVQTAARADRAYQAREWVGANALYMLLLEREPDNPRTYSRVIITADLGGQPDVAPSILERALARSITLDDVLKPLCDDAMALGEAGRYEQFLLRCRSALPWLSRALDARLLDYYTDRRDAEAMVTYSRKLLVGLPDNTDYLNVLASGLLMQGRTVDAVAVWEHILEIDGDNLDALLNLGSYEKDFGDASRGRELLKKACQLKPTPYLERMVD